ncbi:MAG: polyketide synthase [Bogoriella megaspora]|nr:MAG: polyketide synthase [Bogoriella megaspora]
MAPGRVFPELIPHHIHDTDSSPSSFDDDFQHDSDEAIAIIGYALKFPQDATSPEGFWQMLSEGRSAMTDWPKDRLNTDGFYHPRKRDAMSARGAHFMDEDLSAFDADFFSITPSEAAAMDPGQRILLETAYKAFENAGISIENLSGSDTSVHTGCFTLDYLAQIMEDPQLLPTYAVTGVGRQHTEDEVNVLLDPIFTQTLTNMQMLSTDSRSYSFDHRANGYSRGEGIGAVILKPISAALRDNDTIRAVIRASGSNHDGRTPGITQPSMRAQARLIQQTYKKAGLTMQHTRFFEAHGTGTAVGDPAEAEAIADSFRGIRSPADPLYVGAVKSNIGHLEGGAGIASLIKTIMVLETGIIPPNANFERANRKIDTEESPLAFPTSPIAWPISELRRASISSFGYGGSNSHLILDDARSFLDLRGLRGNHQTTVESSGKTKTNGVSKELNKDNLKTPKILVWSAADEKSLRDMIAQCQEFSTSMLANHKVNSSFIHDLAYTLDSRRSRLAYQSWTTVSSVNDLEHLEKNASAPVVRKGKTPRIAFAFTGQGAQWYAMGRELLDYDIFSDVIDDAERYLKILGCNWSVRGELLKSESESPIDRPEYAAPLTTIVQIGLVDLLKLFGVVPSAVLGHSVGEIGAAYCAGVLDREDAFRLAYFRGKFVATVPQRDSMKGGMLAVGLSTADVTSYFEKLRSSFADLNLMVSCVNSPVSVTVSGEVSQLESLTDLLQKDGVFARRLRVSAAYHSPQLEQIAQDCLNHYGTLKIHNPSSNITMISTVTGLPILANELARTEYWVTNMIVPVLFSQAVERLCQQSEKALRKKIDGSHRNAVVVDHIVEIGPHAALKGPIQDTIKTLKRQNDVGYSSVLYRKKSASTTSLELLGNLYCLGVPVNFRRLNDPNAKIPLLRKCLTDLPMYPFNHNARYWHESHLCRDFRLRKYGYRQLLGLRAYEWNPLAPQWRCCIKGYELPWLDDHKINGKSFFPASAMLIMAIEAALQLADPTLLVVGFTLRRVQFHAALLVSTDSSDVEVRTNLYPLPDYSSSDKASWEFHMYSFVSGDWSENCSAIVEAHYTTSDNDVERIKISDYHHATSLRTGVALAPSIDAAAFYRNLRKQGYHYGPSFQGIQSFRHDHKGQATTCVLLSTPMESEPFAEDYSIIHPATLDSILHSSLVAATEGGTLSLPTKVPISIDRLWIAKNGCSSPMGFVDVDVSIDFQTPRTNKSSLYVLTDDGHHVALRLEGLVTSVVGSTSSGRRNGEANAQHWLSMKRNIDLDMLSPTETVQWLNNVCEVDKEEHRIPSSNAQHSILPVLNYVRQEIKKNHLQPHTHYLRKYVDWINLQVRKDAQDQVVGKSVDSSLTNGVEQVENRNLRGSETPPEKLARGILDVLEGKIDAHKFVTGGECAELYFEQHFACSGHFQRLEKYLNTYSFKYPSMQLLEIGTNNRELTKHIFTGLTSSTGGQVRCKQYIYTAATADLLDTAKDRMSPLAHKLEFRVFDVSENPAAQEITEGSFDCVIASNSLLISKDLSRSLQSLRKLLKLGGRLILHLPTDMLAVEQCVLYGLLPEWWDVIKSHREIGSLPFEDTWETLLQANGFSGADIILSGKEEQGSQSMSTIITTAAGERLKPNIHHNVTILIEPDSELQAAIAERLKAKLDEDNFRSAKISLFNTEKSLSPSSADIFISLIDISDPILQRLTAKLFPLLLSVFLSASQILWITGNGDDKANPGHGMIDGFVKTLRIEENRLAISTLALENPIADNGSSAGHIMQVLRRMVHDAKVEELEDYVVRDGHLTIARATEETQLKDGMGELLSGKKQISQSVKECRPLAVELEEPGQLGSLRIIETTTPSTQLRPDEVEIDVHAVGLNEFDALVVNGMSQSTRLGRECAGVVRSVGNDSSFSPGDRVCAFGPDMLRSTVRASEQYVARIPEEVSFAHASTLPLDYLLASYIVNRVARLSPRDTVLVHGGDSSLAKAIICLAHRIANSVYATAQTKEEEVRLSAYFAGTKLSILPYRSLSQHLGHLPGQKVDVIVDLSFQSDLSWLLDCDPAVMQIIHVEPIGKATIQQKRAPALPPNTSFVTVDLNAILRDRLDATDVSLQSLIDNAKYRDFDNHGPQIFRLSNLSTAFSVSDPEMRRKKVILIEDDDQISIIKDLKPEYSFNSHASYVIAGGFGDLGRCIVKWMVKRGACNFIILSRSGPKTEDARQLVTKLEERNVKVYSPRCDVADTTALEQVLRECNNRMPPIKGCIQASGALRDIMYKEMAFEDWKIAIGPKVQGSWNLHQLLPSGMDFFIMTASVTGIIGQASQINYAAANSYQDALARHRIAIGEKAISLDLGLLLTGGMSGTAMERLKKVGHLVPINEPQIYAALEYSCNPSLQLTEPSDAQVIIGLKPPSAILSTGHHLPDGMHHPSWSHLSDTDAQNSTSGSEGVKEEASITTLLHQATTPAEAATLVTRAIAQRFARLLSIADNKINIDEPLHVNGADSLSAVDIRNWISKTFGVDVVVFELLGDIPLTSVGKMVADKWTEANGKGDEKSK